MMNTRAAGTVPAAVESTAYFVIAEALTNAVKHSRATVVTIALGRTANSLSVQVTDKGVGGASAGAGRGLGGIADRVDTLGGLLRITSPPGAGTTIAVELPCAR
jgi:signal transduction histidine kinase